MRPQKAAYAVTRDADIVPGKTYYTESTGEYTKVDSPQKGELSTYYEQTAGAHQINVLIVTSMTTSWCRKYSSIYYFNPARTPRGDGYLYPGARAVGRVHLPQRQGTAGRIRSLVDTDTASSA